VPSHLGFDVGLTTPARDHAATPLFFVHIRYIVLLRQNLYRRRDSLGSEGTNNQKTNSPALGKFIPRPTWCGLLVTPMKLWTLLMFSFAFAAQVDLL
jgi:hypothetical protein